MEKKEEKPKKKGIVKKVLLILVALFLTGIVALSLVSKLYYHRSLMATFVEIYLRVTDRNSLYCDEGTCADNIAEKNSYQSSGCCCTRKEGVNKKHSRKRNAGLLHQ